MLLLTLAGAAIAAGCNAYPAVPAQPAYDLDVRPILMAHCARCHGAGGTQNLATEPTGPNAPPIPSIADPSVQSTFMTTNLWVTQYNDTDCTLDNSGNLPADCKFGAGNFHVTIKGAIDPGAKAPQLMPPAPAPQLNDWEVGVIDNWSANGAPCSNSANPDQTICPPATP